MSKHPHIRRCTYCHRVEYRPEAMNSHCILTQHKYILLDFESKVFPFKQRIMISRLDEGAEDRRIING